MKTITSKIIAMAIVIGGIIFSHSSYAACNMPTTFSTTGITSSVAVLNWSGGSSAISFNLRYRVVSTSTWTSTTSTVSPRTISGLSPSANYEWQVQTRCSNTQTSSWTASQLFTTLIVCNVPTGLNTTSISQTGATLNWTAVSGAVGYNLRYRIVGVSTWTTTTSTTTSKAITSLTGSSNYEWQAQTNCGGSNLSAFSSSSTFSTPAPPCNVPAGLNTTGITSTGATLNWTAVSGAVGYNLRYRIVGVSTWTTTTSTGTSKAITSLTASSSYEWQVQTNCGSSNLSAFSSSATFGTSAPPCNVPSGLNTTGITSTDATLNWTAVSGAVGYNVQYRVVGAPSWTAAASTGTSTTVTSLASASNYEWQVQSNCGSFNLSAFSSSATFSTTSAPCGIPTGLNATGIGPAAATLNWTAVSGAVGYTVEYRETGAPSWTSATTASVSLALTSLNSSTMHEWQVQADCGNSNVSAFSGISTFITHGAPCVVPAGLNTTGITLTDATFDWTNVSGAINYRIQYRELGAPSWIMNNSQTNSLAVTGLNANGNYEWQVQAVCAIGNQSAFSSSAIFVANPAVVPMATFHGTWVGLDANGNTIEVVLNPNGISTFTINGAPISSAGNPGGAIVSYRLPDYLVQTGKINPASSPGNSAITPSGPGRTLKFFTDNAIRGITATTAPSATQSTASSISFTPNVVQQIYTGLALVTLNGAGQYEMALFIDLNDFSSVPPVVDFSINPIGDIPAYANLIRQ